MLSLKLHNNLSNLLWSQDSDKYFQIAPCFRDEDARADRSPGEFYQLDLEMSFVEQEDIFNIVEKLMTSLFKNFSSKKCYLRNFQKFHT